jgi:hypothetical protein
MKHKRVFLISLFLVLTGCQGSGTLKCTLPPATIANIFSLTLVVGVSGADSLDRFEENSFINRTFRSQIGFNDSVYFKRCIKESWGAFSDSARKVNPDDLFPYLETWAPAHLSNLPEQDKQAVLFVWQKTVRLDSKLTDNENYVLKILLKSMNYSKEQWLSVSKQIANNKINSITFVK